MLFVQVKQLYQAVEIYHDKLTQNFILNYCELHDYDYIIFYFNVTKLDT